MAWDYRIVEVNGGSELTSDYTVPVPLNWGEYGVYHIRFGSGITNVTFDFNFDDLPGGYQTGYAIGYLCDGIASWYGSDEVPNSFIDYFALSTPPLAYDVSGIVNCYVVTRPIDSTQSGFARLTIEINGGGGGVRPYYTPTGNYGALSIELQVSNYRDISYSAFNYHIQSLTSGYSDVYTIGSSYHTFTGLSNEVYEVWVTYTYAGSEYDIPNANGGSTLITVFDFTGPSPSETWHYTQYAAQNNITTSGRTLAYNITSTNYVNEGAYCLLRFSESGNAVVNLSRSDMTVYIVPGGNYSYNTSNGAPFLYNGSEASGDTSQSFIATAGEDYYLWVRGNSSSSTGVVTVTITLTTTPVEEWTRSGAGTVNVTTTTASLSFQLSAGRVYLARVTFSTAGIARFYSTGGNDRYAWLMSSDRDIDETTGIPKGTPLASDTSGGDYDFTYTVAANTTYYFWVRSASYYDTTYLYAYFVPASTPSSTKGFWVYNGNEWVKVKPYVYNGSSWVQVKPFVYSSTWIEGS